MPATPNPVDAASILVMEAYVLCGMDPVDVAHIIARRSADQDQVSETCSVQMVTFHKQIGRLIGFAWWLHHCQLLVKMMLSISSVVSSNFSPVLVPQQYVFHVVCPTYHRQYDSGYFVLVPSKRQRELLLEHENRDFASREKIVAHGGRDPGLFFFFPSMTV